MASLNIYQGKIIFKQTKGGWMRSSKEAENDKCMDNLFYCYNINIKHYRQKNIDVLHYVYAYSWPAGMGP